MEGAQIRCSHYNDQVTGIPESTLGTTPLETFQGACSKQACMWRPRNSNKLHADLERCTKLGMQ